jgi:DNA primase catalytic core
MNEIRKGTPDTEEVDMKEIIARVKSEVSLVKVFADYGFQLIKQGGNYVCSCPFHAESKPSCTLYPETNRFYCYGCLTHGDVIEFVRLREHLGFREALAKLASQIGIDIPAPNEDEGDRTRRRLTSILDHSALFFHRTLELRLKKRDPVIEIFLRDRGISPQSLEKFKIGFAPSNDELVNYLLDSRRFRPSDVLDAGVLKRDRHGKLFPFFWNRVIFPFLKDGRVVYLTGRSVNQTEPRYLNLPAGEFFRKTIYNAEALRSAAKDIYITEGIIDCILAEQTGFSAIALAGMVANDDLAKLLNDKKVYIAFDSEESGAGQKGAEKLASDLLIHEKDARIITLPRRPGVAKVDLADYLSSEGKDNFLSLIKQSTNLIELRINRAGQENDVTRIELIRSSILPLICHPRIADMDRARYLTMMKDKLALKTEVFQALKKEASAIKKNWRSDYPVEISTEKSHELTAQEREDAIRYLKDPNLVQNLVADIRKIGILGEDSNALALYLFSLTRKSDKPISAVVFGDSSGGKSYLVNRICSLIPNEDLLLLSSASPRSFEHASEDMLKHKFIVVQEIEGMEEVEPTIRIMQSEGRLSRLVSVKNEVTDKYESMHKDVECPACIITTTTRDRVHPENSTRIFELYVNQTVEQTAQIHDLQRQKVTLEWAAIEKEQASVKVTHANVQRLIKYLKAVIPFAKHISFPQESLRSRRDFERFLSLIQAVALFRQFQKEVKRTGGDEEYIVADLEDYKVAFELGMKLFTATFSPISERTMDVFRVCLQIESETFTRDDVKRKAKELEIHVSENRATLARQLSSLCDDVEALELVEGSQGKTCLYRKKVSAKEELNGAQISLIPTADQIAVKISREREEKEAAHELACTSQN